MGISKYPSCVSLACMEKPYPTILDYLAQRFPQIGRAAWEQRIMQGKVHDHAGIAITKATLYVPQKRLFYFREVAEEPLIPLLEKVIFQNDDLMVVCKPPFLPVNPTGPYVNECLLHRLKIKTGNCNLVPLHRIDRETSGIVLFSSNQKTRALYHNLFMTGRIEKTYLALAAVTHRPKESNWMIENRLAKGEPWFRTHVVPGKVNARSSIKLVACNGNLAKFRLSPLTGKQHQLRVHMSDLGFPILHDRYYPQLLPKQADDLQNPLQLIAHSVNFIDPISGRKMEFSSSQQLQLPVNCEVTFPQEQGPLFS